VNKQNLIIIFSIFITIFLFFGTESDRINKGIFLSKNVYFPLISSIERIRSFNALKKENKKLLERNIDYELEIAKYQRLLLINTNKKKIYHKIKNRFKIAEIIGITGVYTQRNLILNVGKMDGISPGMPIISINGIVGKVISVSQNSAIALPFNNKDFKLAIMDKSTGTQGLLEAQITGSNFMNYIKIGSQVSIGDTVVTSNLSQVFPKNLPVGKIKQIININSGMYYKAEIEPFVNVENLGMVAILAGGKNEEIRN